MIKQFLGGFIVWSALACSGLQASIIFTTQPANGAVSAAPGGTTGFGFTLTNTNANYIVVTLSDFCVGAPVSPCSNSLGTYTDIIGNNFVIVGPAPESPSVTQSFNLANQTGVGSFQINNNAALGSSVSGQLILTYDVYATDPANGGSPTSSSLTISAPASITAARTVAGVPEPSTLFLLSGALGGLAFWRKRRAF